MQARAKDRLTGLYTGSLRSALPENDIDAECQSGKQKLRQQQAREYLVNICYKYPMVINTGIYGMPTRRPVLRHLFFLHSHH